MRRVLFILGQLSDTDVAWLAEHGRRQRIAAGTQLIRQGTHIDTLYIVLEGSLSVLTARGVKLGEVCSGDILGEMSLVDAHATAAAVRADRDCVVLAVSKQLLQDKLDADVHFAARFYRALSLFLADRMRNTMRTMGYGEDEAGAASPADFDELDPDVLDRVHLAGARFERMLKRLAGS